MGDGPSIYMGRAAPSRAEMGGVERIDWDYIWMARPPKPIYLSGNYRWSEAPYLSVLIPSLGMDISQW